MKNKVDKYYGKFTMLWGFFLPLGLIFSLIREDPGLAFITFLLFWLLMMFGVWIICIGYNMDKKSEEEPKKKDNWED